MRWPARSRSSPGRTPGTSPARLSRSTAASAWVTETTCGSEGEKAMGILEGKNILVTGVLTDASIAYHVARVAQEEGATVILTAFPRPTLTDRIAKKLPVPPPVLELDVTNLEHMGSLADRIREHF